MSAPVSGPIAVGALDLAALLCSRVCHDLISPVGAIVNGIEVLDEGVVPVRNHVEPAVLVGERRNGGPRQPEISGAPVGAHDEGVADMLDVVFMIGLARQKNLEPKLTIGGMREAPFR